MDADVVLVLTIAAAVRGHVFSSRELLDHAKVDEPLRAALAGFTARQLGKKLRALAGCPIDGLMITYVGRDDDGSLWCLQVAEPFTGPR